MVVSPRIPDRDLTPGGFDYPFRCCDCTLPLLALRCLARLFQLAAFMGFRTSAGSPASQPPGVIRRTMPSCRYPVLAVFLPEHPALSPAPSTTMAFPTPTLFNVTGPFASWASSRLNIRPTSGLLAAGRSLTFPRGISPSDGQIRSCPFPSWGFLLSRGFSTLRHFVPLPSLTLCASRQCRTIYKVAPQGLPPGNRHLSVSRPPAPPGFMACAQCLIRLDSSTWLMLALSPRDRVGLSPCRGSLFGGFIQILRVTPVEP